MIKPKVGGRHTSSNQEFSLIKSPLNDFSKNPGLMSYAYPTVLASEWTALVFIVLANVEINKKSMHFCKNAMAV